MNMSKFLLTLLFPVSVISMNAQNPQLKKLWETDSTLRVPESVLYYAGENVLFVSNIDGKPEQKDLKGSISKVGTDGKIIDLDWATNLSAPKGMGIYEGNLFVADIAEVVVLNLKTGKVVRRIPVKDAVFLNDVTIDKAGTVYVSDSRAGKVYSISNDEVSLYMDKKNGVNGLLAVDDHLYMTVRDTVYKADKNKQLVTITTGIDGSSDGIVMVDDSSFLVSCWNGVIYYVGSDGSKKILIDTRAEKLKSADIGFNPRDKTLFVPTFYKNTVAAYEFVK